MSETITEMTAEQEARIPEWIEKWIKIGLSTEPLDFDKAEQAVLQAYQFVGLEKPKTALRVASPLQPLLKNYKIFKKFESQARSKIYSKINLKFFIKINSQLISKIDFQVRSQVNKQVAAKVDEQVWEKVYLPVHLQIKSQINLQNKNSIYGLCNAAFWIPSVAYISFLRDVLNWQDSVLDQFKILEDLAISCGYAWCHEDVLIISDRPKQINLDNEGRLHSETEPALVYRDGWSLYFWHGFAVSQFLIERPQDITIEMIKKESNDEIRRIMIDRFSRQVAIIF